MADFIRASRAVAEAWVNAHGDDAEMDSLLAQIGVLERTEAELNEEIFEMEGDLPGLSLVWAIYHERTGWHLATIVPLTTYSHAADEDDLIWGELGTFEWLGPVGDEVFRVPLGPAPEVKLNG